MVTHGETLLEQGPQVSGERRARPETASHPYFANGINLEPLLRRGEPRFRARTSLGVLGFLGQSTLFTRSQPFFTKKYIFVISYV